MCAIAPCCTLLFANPFPACSAIIARIKLHKRIHTHATQTSSHQRLLRHVLRRLLCAPRPLLLRSVSGDAKFPF
uniref:Putative secreted peptide n=1 Tax=Anopheles braziliensis TaxID=58242 RepID=A0A2M3ZUR4_9DIPT